MSDVVIDSIKKDGATYYQLYIKCPICNERGINVPPSYWLHDVDDGDIYIGDNAFYYCKECGYTEHLMKWRYRCSTHSSSDDDYVELTDVAAYADVISAAGQLVRIAGLPWLQEVFKNLDHY